MMKRILCIFFISLIMSVASFSRVTSKVTVIVKDLYTGNLLSGVTIFLQGYEEERFPPCEINPIFDYTRKSSDKTDKNGEISFEDVWADNYYLYCVKDDYVSINPCYLENEKDPKYMLKTFRVSEGEIKVIRVGMKKGGGGFRVLVRKKDESGISPVFYSDLQIEKYSKSVDPKTGKRYLYQVFRQPLIPKLYPDSSVVLKGFEAGEEFVIKVEKDGLPKRIKNFVVKEGEISDVTFLYDYTDKTGIKIILKYSTKKVDFLSLDLAKKKFISSIIGRNNVNEYIFRSLEPGKYTLYVFFNYENEEMRKKIFPFIVEKNKTTELIINF